MKFGRHMLVLGVSAFTLASPLMARAVLMDAERIQFNEVPGFVGITTATVEGDAAAGPHHSYMKMQAGFTAPLHHHTADHFVSVLAGTMIFNVDGVEYRLPAGSYFSFTEKQMHTTKCAEGEDCVLFLDVRDSWDVIMDAESQADQIGDSAGQKASQVSVQLP